ncbi:type II secretion system F family protein [Vannielia litorea]|uniref:type II secretion system F family protein n=1 Tax=Vannielia TaxID=2813041 RepID=UPI001C97EEC9|nr:type II secretion system F family protein [Vannielia litorea]MBY6048166.1 type II secretion system F family protein [Vannielia litorea]MBY6075580.1 type II secretion system F family protein [Vannielia litorea]
MELLQNANDWLIATFGDLGPLYAIGALGLVLVLLTLPSFLKKPADPMDKLKGTGGGARAAKADDPKGAKLRTKNKNAEKLDKFATFLEPQSAEEMSAARLKMMQAGYRSKNAVRIYHFIQFSLGIGMLLIGLLIAIISSANGEVETQQLLMMVLIPGFAGYYLPRYWVNRRLQQRQGEITNGFPDSLDMMLVCVEAGQSMDQAIIRVSKEIKQGYPALAEEYEIVAHEVKAGKDKTNVLKDMSERCGVPDIASFVTVMIQSASFGTSIADALRVFSEEMRDKRVMRAEEKANVLPTKLTLGTMMFTVPPLMIILIGPSVYQIYDTLSNATFF